VTLQEAPLPAENLNMNSPNARLRAVILTASILIALVPCGAETPAGRDAQRAGRDADRARQDTGPSAPAAPVPPAPEAPAEPKAVPSAWRSISLGMGLEAVKEELRKDGSFGYRGDRDVSLLPTMNRTLIETSGGQFIRRAWFQFHEDKLYTMTFNLDPDQFDYFSLYSSLVRKYGEPTSLDPRKALWRDDRVILTLERPLTVKYVDREVFERLLGESGVDEAATTRLRAEFIDEF